MDRSRKPVTRDSSICFDEDLPATIKRSERIKIYRERARMQDVIVPLLEELDFPVIKTHELRELLLEVQNEIWDVLLELNRRANG